MAETVNIGEIANRLSEDIFKFFLWKTHPRRDENFKCNNPEHLTGGNKPKQKDTHPADVIFYYEDPYLGRRVYLHTDLKSYGKDSIGTVKLRAAIESLAMSVECAKGSAQWRQIYSATTEDQFDIRGLLFVHNHDKGYEGNFQKAVEATDLSSIPIAPHIYIHFLGPADVSRLFTIANDIIRLQYEKLLPDNYSFYYPDLVMWRRQGDVWGQAATIEALTAPYFMIKYPAREKIQSGYLIYYNRRGETPEEFEYFLDSLSRYQMLVHEEFIRVRIVHVDPHPNFLSNFKAATEKYARAWGFDPKRIEVLEAIDVKPVTAVATTYSAPYIGWRAPK
ncbi:MAG: hypothetical protein CK604_02465 [Curvibacter sp. PD_MW3]|nr:MAG: hypothetical protein CK604_02465 [Curvibacter sp. PD_MW3]